MFMYTCQCEGCQKGQSSGVLLRKVTAFQRCPVVEVYRRIMMLTNSGVHTTMHSFLIEQQEVRFMHVEGKYTVRLRYSKVEGLSCCR